MKPAKKKLVPNTSSVTERWKKKVAIKKTKILQAIAVSENSGYTTGTDPAPLLLLHSWSPVHLFFFFFFYGQRSIITLHLFDFHSSPLPVSMIAFCLRCPLRPR